MYSALLKCQQDNNENLMENIRPVLTGAESGYIHNYFEVHLSSKLDIFRGFGSF